MTLEKLKVVIAEGVLFSLLLALTVPAVAQKCADDPVFGVHKENLEITKKQAADYKPGARNSYVRDFNDSENVYLKAVLSPARRKAWFERWKDPNFPKCMNPELDQLAAVARKTLPSYKPTGFTVRNAAEEQLLAGGGAGKTQGQGKTEQTHVARFEGVDNADEIRDVIAERVRRYRDAGLGDPEAAREAGKMGNALEAAQEALEEARELRKAIGSGALLG